VSLPARKQPGASRRRKNTAHLRRVKRRLLGIRPLRWNNDGTLGEPILKDVRRMIALLEKDRAQ
jgi:hypothetical protein